MSKYNPEFVGVYCHECGNQAVDECQACGKLVCDQCRDTGSDCHDEYGVMYPVKRLSAQEHTK